MTDVVETVFDWCSRGVHEPRCPGRGATLERELVCSCECHGEAS